MICTYPMRISPLACLSFFLVFASFFMSCGISGGNNRDAEGLVFTLHSPDPAVRDSARQRLDGYLFLKKDLPVLYEALRQSYPDDTVAIRSTRQRLLLILEDVNDASTPEFIQSLYPTLEEFPALQGEALHVLVHISSQASLAALADILVAEKGTVSTDVHLLFKPLYQYPRQVGALFPTILHLLQRREYAYPVLETLYAGLEAGVVDTKPIQDSLILIREVYRGQKRRKDRLHPGSRSYQTAFSLMEASMRCLVYFSDQPIGSQVLELAVADSDPEMQLAVVNACLEVDTSRMGSLLHTLAGDFRYRTRLYHLLEAKDALAFFPSSYYDQQAFAASDLAVWLQDPDHRGSFPEEIVYLNTYPIALNDEQDSSRVYLYKFRFGKKWMVGLSGPQPSDSLQVAAAGHLTHSRYQSLEAKSEEEHLEELLGEEK